LYLSFNNPLLKAVSTQNTEFFISPSGNSELSCTTTKTDTVERNISIGAEALQVFFCLRGSIAYLQVSPLGGSHDETWRGQGIRKYRNQKRQHYEINGILKRKTDSVQHV
jgi:hypothetical protein